MRDVSITKKQWDAYVTVRDSGLTNMWDVREARRLALEMTGVELSKDEYTTILRNYAILKDMFVPVERTEDDPVY